MDKEPTLKEVVLDYCFENKKYMAAYKIIKADKTYQAKVLDAYNAHNWTIYKMLGYEATVEDVKKLLQELKIEEDVHEKIILLGLIKSSRLEQAEEFFFNTPEDKHKEYWSFAKRNINNVSSI